MFVVSTFINRDIECQMAVALLSLATIRHLAHFFTVNLGISIRIAFTVKSCHVTLSLDTRVLNNPPPHYLQPLYTPNPPPPPSLPAPDCIFVEFSWADRLYRGHQMTKASPQASASSKVHYLSRNSVRSSHQCLPVTVLHIWTLRDWSLLKLW